MYRDLKKLAVDELPLDIQKEILETGFIGEIKRESESVEFDTYITEVIEVTLNRFGPEGAMRLSSALNDAALKDMNDALLEDED